MPLGALLLRRDANRVRRGGTGRQTTKRTFAISLPAPGLSIGAVSAAATPGRGLKRNSKVLEAEAAAQQQSSLVLDEAPDSGPADELPIMPNSEAAFRRASKLMRTPVGPAAPPAIEVRARTHQCPLQCAARSLSASVYAGCILTLHSSPSRVLAAGGAREWRRRHAGDAHVV